MLLLILLPLLLIRRTWRLFHILLLLNCMILDASGQHSIGIITGQATNMTSETSFSYTIPTNLNAYQLERRSLKIKEIFTNVVKTVRQLQEEAERADKIITTTTMTEREMVASTRDVTKLYRMAQKGFDRLLDQTVRLTNVFHQYLDANQKVRDLIDLAVVDALDVAVRMDQTGAAERDISDQYRAITNRTKVLMDQLREVIQQSRERQLEKNEQELRQWHRFIVRAEIGVQEILTTTQETWKSTKQMFTTTYDHTNQTLRALLKIRRSRQEMQQDLLLLLKDPRGRSNNPPYVTVPESNKPIPRRIVELFVFGLDRLPENVGHATIYVPSCDLGDNSKEPPQVKCKQKEADTVFVVGDEEAKPENL
ncbi:unnamed protein product [Caenorhabditis bovis]|uniref:Uncharacterized protein n=1 Tax=Caenorhabditis bovis TaxID=2654633 RepID=A0A8S1F7W4_9PELO|nr:unnamed protein product [Caenorhabditis bovis]